DGDAYRLSMRIGAELRTIADPSCRELFVAAVVVAASFVEGTPPNATASGPEPVPTPVTPVAPVASATAVPPSAPQQDKEPSPRPPADNVARAEASARAARGVGFGVGAGVGTSFGFLPQPSVAAELVVSAQVP